MQGNTHAVCGSAIAVYALAPATMPALLGAAVGGMLGALCPDIDCDTSHAHRGCVKFVAITAVLFALCFALDHFYGTTLLATIASYEQGRWTIKRIAGLILLIAYLIAGAMSEHRTLTHSLLGMAIAVGAVYLVAPGIWPSFAIGYASHIALDLLNKQKEQLLWPFGEGAALYVCKSNGAANKLFGLGGTIALVAVVLTSTPVRMMASDVTAFISSHI